MKLRTSYFNGTVLKKDITRFSPVWALYTVFTLLYVILLYDDMFYSADYTFSVMGAVNLGYGGICALMLFGDLFKSRLCNALHAMPMRREGWFFTHLTAGLLFCLVPNLVGAGLAAILIGQVQYVAFLWLLVAVLSYLFFFGVGVFSVMCAGSRLGAAAIYALINFLAVLLAWLVDTFYAPALPGVVLDLSWMAKVCPVLQLSQLEFIDISIHKYQGLQVNEILWESFGYAAIVAAVGIAFLALALLVYRKRKLETAGDFLSLKPISPVFLVLYTLSVGAIFYLIAELFGGEFGYAFLVVGLIVGFFTGCMLLEKRVKVFRKKRFLQLAVVVLCFFGTVTVTWLDPIGITRYVPESSQVQSVSISPFSVQDGITSVTLDKYYYQREALTLTELGDIEAIRTVHQHCIDNPINSKPILSGGGYEVYENSWTPLTITYKLKNGTTVQRRYKFSANSEAGKILKPYFSSAEYILGTENVADLLSRTMYMEYHPNQNNVVVRFQPGSANNARIEDTASAYDPPMVSYHVVGTLDNSPEAGALLNGILADCKEGTMAQLYDYHGDVVGSLSIQYRDENKGNQYKGNQYMDITIYSDSANTVACLKQLAEK